MRYITNARLCEGMVLAQPFYGAKFEILLGEGMTLNAYHIQRINELGYPGIYIHDEISADVTVLDAIPREMRIKTIKATRDILQRAERNGEDAAKVTRERQSKIIMPVINALLANPNRLVDMLDLKPYDDYNYYHAANVVILSLLTGIELGFSDAKLFELGMAALLHDLGSVFIPKSILNKPGKLTPEEFEIIKSHSQMGFDYLYEHFDIPIEACMGALQHHENYNGTGYPNKLKRDKISIYGRIIAVTNVYDALTSRRPFRQPVYPPAAMDFLDASAGTMFDPEILDALKRVVAMYPLGSCVELDSGVRCIVVGNYHGDTARPKLRLLGSMAREALYVDLHADPQYAAANVSQMVDF